jgi:hypothetical protein
MCLIVVREPGIEIPFNHIESACNVNGDGWGLIVHDRNKLDVRKEFNPKGNDAERIYKFLEDAKDHRIALHLRYSTAGARDADNCHPFPVLTPDEDGIDVQLMHNGTISGMVEKNSDRSDTYWFNEKIVRPLLKRSAALVGPEGAIADPFVHDILTHYRGWSRFVLFDSEGKALIIGQAEGKQFDGWWASNDYSFDRTHRSVVASDSDIDYDYGTYYGSNYKYYRPNSDPTLRIGQSKGSTIIRPEQFQKDTSAKHVPQVSSKSQDESTAAKETKTEAAEISEVFEMLKHEHPTTDIEIESLQDRETFCDLACIDSLEEVCKLEPDDVSQLVENYPRMATLLILDLLYELYLKVNEERVTH